MASEQYTKADRRMNATTLSVPRKLFPSYLYVSVCMKMANLNRWGETSSDYDQFAGGDSWRWEVCKLGYENKLWPSRMEGGPS